MKLHPESNYRFRKSFISLYRDTKQITDIILHRDTLLQESPGPCLSECAPSLVRRSPEL